MRTVVNISLPASVRAEIEQEVRDGGFVSMSEFFRALYREHCENVALKGITHSRQQFASGKGKPLTSLADLR